jgi:hypothetical protein
VDRRGSRGWRASGRATLRRSGLVESRGFAIGSDDGETGAPRGDGGIADHGVSTDQPCRDKSPSAWILVEAEIAARDESNLAARLRAAAFPVVKTLDEFQLSVSSIPKATFDYLTSTGWNDAAENVVLVPSTCCRSSISGRPRAGHAGSVVDAGPRRPGPQARHRHEVAAQRAPRRPLGCRYVRARP